MEIKSLTNQVRLARWTEIISDKARSEKSARKYCAENGINEKTYYYWQRKLREKAGEIYESLANPKSSSQVPAVFAEVALSPAKEINRSKEDLSGQLQIEIGEMRLTADSHYPAETLTELLIGLLRS